ncbi:MAG: hypothetical protein ACYC7A_21395 [Thermoanaerobaculia bacterium]
MQRFVLTLQYLGTRYSGWQRQTNAVAIQELVENALEAVCGTRVTASASGRTDAGVHAAALPLHADVFHVATHAHVAVPLDASRMAGPPRRSSDTTISAPSTPTLKTTS